MEQDTGYVPVLDSIPATLKLNLLQFRAFHKWWDSRWEYMWADIRSEYQDSIYLVHISMKPNFQFIRSLKTPSLLRYQQYINSHDFRFACLTDPDILDALKLPLLKSEASLKLFKQPDSIFLIQSYEHYFELKSYKKRNLMCHIFYNHPEQSYELKIIDTLLNVSGSAVLFKADPDTSISYDIHIPMPSTIQVIQHHRQYNEQTGFIRHDSFEIKRLFIDSLGSVHDWSAARISPAKYCSTMPLDSTFDYHFHGHLDRIKSSPVTLNMQEDILDVLSLDDPSFPYAPKYYSEPLSIFYFQYLISDNSDLTLFSISNPYTNSMILVLSDENSKIRDAIELNPVRKNNDYTWSRTEISGKLTSDQTIYILDRYETRDTLNKIFISEGKIHSTRKPLQPLTMPVSNLDPYFSFTDKRVFTSDSIENIYQNVLQLKQFPDSVYKCLQEMALQNGGHFFGKNYSITHPSNGLTYLMVVQEGNVEVYLSMYIIDQHNVMRNEYVQLAGGGGDEGDYWGSYGHFVNDSTYHITSKACAYESICDSTLRIFHILSNGKILVDESENRKYRLPYR